MRKGPNNSPLLVAVRKRKRFSGVSDNCILVGFMVSPGVTFPFNYPASTAAFIGMSFVIIQTRSVSPSIVYFANR